MKNLLLIALFAVSSHVYASAPTPYAGQETRDIKALSANEISSLLAGRGMGFAKAAELNGFPGPAHVLELSKRLGLTEAQKEQTSALFETMDVAAKQKGAELVAAERDLDLLFKSKQITPESLSKQLQRVAGLQAQVREVHLVAHLEQVKLLTVEQVAKYNELRGYTGANQHEHMHGGKH